MKTVLILCVLLVSVAGMAQSMTPEDFIRQAAEDNLAHVEAGRMAQGGAAVPSSVQQLGRQMEAGAVRMNERLSQLAAARNMALLPQIPAAGRHTLERLSKLQGGAFTRHYLSHVLDSLEHGRALFQVATVLDDAEVAQFARESLPSMETRLLVAGAVFDAQVPEFAR